MELKGVINAIITPMEENEDVDEQALRKLINYELKAGVHGLWVLGTMGAVDILTYKQRRKTLEIVCDEVKKIIPVIAGIADTSVKKVLENAKELEDLPIDYYSVLTPYMIPKSQEELKIFYTKISESLSKPILMYNNPYKISYLTPETIIELSEIPNIAGIKDAYEDINMVYLCDYFRNRNNFSYIVGTELFAFDAFAYGARGVIGGIQCLIPKIAVDMYNYMKSGDYKSAFDCQKRLSGIMTEIIIKVGNIWGGVEAAYKILNICNKITGEPHCSITDKKELKEIKKMLDKYYYN